MYRNDQHAMYRGRRTQQSASGPPSHHVHHEFDGTAEITTTLVHALADVAGVDVTRAESALSDHFDVHALNTLFRPTGNGTGTIYGSLQFTVLECEATIFSDGRIRIVPLQGHAPGHA